MKPVIKTINAPKLVAKPMVELTVLKAYCEIHGEWDVTFPAICQPLGGGGFGFSSDFSSGIGAMRFWGEG